MGTRDGNAAVHGWPAYRFRRGHCRQRRFTGSKLPVAQLLNPPRFIGSTLPGVPPFDMIQPLDSRLGTATLGREGRAPVDLSCPSSVPASESALGGRSGFAILRPPSATTGDWEAALRGSYLGAMNCRICHVSRIAAALGLGALVSAIAGCGTTKSQQATEQLLTSDAVDRSISGIDFTVLRGESVYLDTQFIKPIKGQGFVNADYIISSLRQQIFAAGCQLRENRHDARFILEARVGALGTDGHEVTYGLPASNALSTAASILPNAPPIPAIPEIAFAKRDQQLGAAKIAVFAYERESYLPVWQSGISVAKSDARHTWILGAGPIQQGTIYNGARFAGDRIPLLEEQQRTARGAVVPYDEEAVFAYRNRQPEGRQVNHEQEPAELDHGEKGPDGEPAESKPAN